MEFIFSFSVFFLQVLFINSFEIVEIVRAFRVDTLVDDEVFPILLMFQGMRAVWTFQSQNF